MADTPITAEQAARDMLERMDVPEAQSFTSGDLTELANLIAARCTHEDVALLTRVIGQLGYLDGTWRDVNALTELRDRLAARLPPDGTAPPLRLERGDPRTFEQKLNDAL